MRKWARKCADLCVDDVFRVYYSMQVFFKVPDRLVQNQTPTAICFIQKVEFSVAVHFVSWTFEEVREGSRVRLRWISLSDQTIVVKGEIESYALRPVDARQVRDSLTC